MLELTIPEILADLANDSEHAAAVSDLEGLYLHPLERLTTDPALLDAVCEVRRTLAQAGLALRRLALVEVA
jgi:hypothetical protein